MRLNNEQLKEALALYTLIKYGLGKSDKLKDAEKHTFAMGYMAGIAHEKNDQPAIYKPIIFTLIIAGIFLIISSSLFSIASGVFK